MQWGIARVVPVVTPSEADINELLVGDSGVNQLSIASNSML